MPENERPLDNPDVPDLVGLIAQDAERLLAQHLELFRAEFRQGLGELPAAAVSITAGAGLVATAGILATLMLVHGLHRSTRIPLWGCYGMVGGLLATVGGGLVATGVRRAGHVRVLPRESLAALREDVQWIKDQEIRPAD